MDKVFYGVIVGCLSVTAVAITFYIVFNIIKEIAVGF